MGDWTRVIDSEEDEAGKIVNGEVNKCKAELITIADKEKAANDNHEGKFRLLLRIFIVSLEAVRRMRSRLNI